MNEHFYVRRVVRQRVLPWPSCKRRLPLSIHTVTCIAGRAHCGHPADERLWVGQGTVLRAGAAFVPDRQAVSGRRAASYMFRSSSSGSPHSLKAFSQSCGVNFCCKGPGICPSAFISRRARFLNSPMRQIPSRAPEVLDEALVAPKNVKFEMVMPRFIFERLQGAHKFS